MTGWLPAAGAHFVVACRVGAHRTTRRNRGTRTRRTRTHMHWVAAAGLTVLRDAARRASRRADRGAGRGWRQGAGQGVGVRSRRAARADWTEAGPEWPSRVAGRLAACRRWEWGHCLGTAFPTPLLPLSPSVRHQRLWRPRRQPALKTHRRATPAPTAAITGSTSRTSRHLPSDDDTSLSADLTQQHRGRFAHLLAQQGISARAEGMHFLSIGEKRGVNQLPFTYSPNAPPSLPAPLEVCVQSGSDVLHSPTIKGVSAGICHVKR